MKVFEVRTEHCRADGNEIIESVQYVTSEKDTLLSVTEYFAKHCEEDLKSVKEVVNIVQHIKI